jgi:hypothetical protein
MVFSVSWLGRRGSGSGRELPRWRHGGSATSKLGVIQEFWLGCLAVAGLWGIFLLGFLFINRVVRVET